ncbi:unnamed protein product [Amaranthus hypochondriacus]
MCERCNAGSESIIHALCDCSSTRVIWSQGNSRNTLDDAPRTSAAEFLSWVADHSTPVDFLSICTSLWAAWLVRNKMLFSDEAVNPVVISSKMHKLVQDYNAYQTKTQCPLFSNVLRFSSWHPPLDTWVKINFDAHVPSGNRRGLGIVARDKNGKLLVAGVRRVVAKWSVETSEAAAALFAVELMARLGYRLIHLEGDALPVVLTIDNRSDGYSPIHTIYDKLYSVISLFDGFVCSHVSRSGNTLAHAIARWDTGVASERICMDPFPQELLTLAGFD